MADAAIYYNDYISEISGYSMYSELRIGSNGDPWGEAEIASGTSPEDAQFGRFVWDANLEDGFDGSMNGELIATLDEQEQTAAGVSQCGEEVLTYSSCVTGDIDRVQVRALAQTAGAAIWSNLQIQFFRGGILVDSYSSASGVFVDETAETGTVASEAILEVSSQEADIDCVVISGEYRMFYDSTLITPGATDLAGQFFVFLE